jgi:hypothetical protein
MALARSFGQTMLAGRPPPAAVNNNLELWLRSDSGVGLTAGGLVQSWADLSGHSPARDAVQTTAGNQPGFTAVDANFNNQPSLNFNGATNNRFLAGSCPITQIAGIAGQSFTAMAVSKMAVASQSGHTNAGEVLLQNAANRDYRYGNAADTQYAFGLTTVIVHFIRSKANSINAETKDLFEKDVIKATSAATVGALTLTQYRVGRLFDDVFPFNGDIAEIAVWSKALTDTQIAALAGAAILRYAIP